MTHFSKIALALALLSSGAQANAPVAGEPSVEAGIYAVEVYRSGRLVLGTDVTVVDGEAAEVLVAPTDNGPGLAGYIWPAAGGGESRYALSVDLGRSDLQVSGALDDGRFAVAESGRAHRGYMLVLTKKTP